MIIPRFLRVILKVIAGITVFAVVGIAVLLGSLWLDHTRETTLPVPSGTFEVGRTTYVWNDAEHWDPMAPLLETHRELAAWVWYPASPRRSAQTAVYLPAPWRKALERHSGVLITQLMNRDLSRVQTHSVRDADLSPQERTYPVVLMRAGLSKLTASYTSLAEDLASHGYVVVGFDAPYRTTIVVLPDGRVIERAPQNNLDAFGGPQQEQIANHLVRAWSADMSFAVDQLEGLNKSDPSGKFRGRLDMQRVGVFGHSLGGATALQFCHDDTRCKAGIDVDGAPLGSVVGEGVTQPFMFILSDHSGEPEAESRPVLANIHSIYQRLSSDRRLEIVIPGTNHYRFSDDGALLQLPLLIRALRTLGIVRIDGRRQIALTTHYIDTFFDVYLKGAPASELKSQAEYPEIKYLP